MTTICNHCKCELHERDCYDVRVAKKRWVHKACYPVRIQQRPNLAPGHDKPSDLPMDVKNTLRGGR